MAETTHLGDIAELLAAAEFVRLHFRTSPANRNQTFGVRLAADYHMDRGCFPIT
jgi:hypothetical protein